MSASQFSTRSAAMSPLSAGRRRALMALGAAALAAPLGSPRAAGEKVKSKARIVIAGGGAAGLATANRLVDALDGAGITVIDNRQQHVYQPGLTLVGGGIRPSSYVVSNTADYMPRAVDWVNAQVAEFDPEANQVVTTTGQTIPYDFLVVTTGMVLEYGLIEGMSPDLIGKHGIGSIYNGPQAAADTWQAMSSFAERGGRGVFLRPATEMKCAGAPLKFTFITDDQLRRRGRRGNAELVYNSNSRALFSVPIVHEKVRMLYQDRNIEVRHDRVLQAIDPGAQRLFFRTPDGMEEQPYDFVHVIPPMRAPQAVRESPLPWQEGAWGAEGWMEVDRATLRHVRFPNVFGVGDIAGVPKGKTAASVKWQVPVAVAHLVAELAGGRSDAHYNGYTSCPLITRLGRAMLIEFDYENNLLPSFPGLIAPLEEEWASWLVKTMGLKPTYLAMLRGRA